LKANFNSLGPQKSLGKSFPKLIMLIWHCHWSWSHLVFV